MADRRPIQQAHERAYVEHFLKWFNRAYKTDFDVISEPNPPEAIVRSSRRTRWVEVGTAFWTSNYAKDLYSYATPGEQHKTIGKGPFVEMDDAFAVGFVSVVKKKLEKTSYIPWRDRYGPGYLVVPVMHPWFDQHTVRKMSEAWRATTVNDRGCFRSIYLATRLSDGIKVSRWEAR